MIFRGDVLRYLILSSSSYAYVYSERITFSVFIPFMVSTYERIIFLQVCLCLQQARRQDSVTGGAEIKFGGAREVYFVWIRKGHGGTRNLSLSGSKEQGVVRKFKGIFRPKTGDHQKKKKVFAEISRDLPAQIANSSGFPAENR